MKLLIAIIKGSILIMLLLGLSGCQELVDQYLPPETQQEIVDEIKEKAGEAIEQVGQDIKDEAGDILEGIKTDIETEIKSSQPELFACSTSPALCPSQTDKNMSSEWKQVTALYTNSPDDRNILYYLAAIHQFKVESDYQCRYKPFPGNGCKSGTSDTRCNIFAADVMRAMGVPLPTKGELGVGSGTSKNTDPMTANAPSLHKWLLKEQDGWRRIDVSNQSDLDELLTHLHSGKPGVISDDGHIAVLRPDQLMTNLSTADIGNLLIAQAGATNKNSMTFKKSFGNVDADIFIHD